MQNIYRIEDIMIISFMFLFAFVSLFLLYRVMKKSVLFNGSLNSDQESNFAEEFPKANDKVDS